MDADCATKIVFLYVLGVRVVWDHICATREREWPYADYLYYMYCIAMYVYNNLMA